MLAALTTSDLNLLIAPVQVSHTYIIGPSHVCAFIYDFRAIILREKTIYLILEINQLLSFLQPVRRLVLFINILVDFESFHLYFNINILLLLEYYTQTTLRGII